MSDQDSGPKPGHFLPGGAGDAGESSTPAPSSKLPHLTKPESVGRSADTGHLGQRQYGRKDIRHDLPVPEPSPAKRLSKPAIAGLIALTLLLLAGGVFGATKIIGSVDLSESSQPAPTTRPPTPVDEPSPTVTVVAPEPNYDQIVTKNKIYATGRLTPSGCKEPAVRPTSKQNVQKFYQAMLPCLSRSWAPAVQKAGFKFQAPKIVVYEGIAEDSCDDYSTGPFYCGADGAIFLPWPDDVKDYKKYPIGTRVEMADTLAHEFGHHVQHLTGILDASNARASDSANKEEELQESRRVELQASCWAAVYLGANKALSLPGELLDAWDFQAKHSGDEYDPAKVRDHGSRKSHQTWLPPAFKSASPGSCNTFTAPAAKVS